MKKLICGTILLIGLLATSNYPTKPNVLIILTDDRGYGDIGCHENPEVKIPAIDRLQPPVAGNIEYAFGSIHLPQGPATIETWVTESGKPDKGMRPVHVQRIEAAGKNTSNAEPNP